MSGEGVVDLCLDSHIFDLAPVSLWLRDYSGVLPLFTEWRARGVRSLAEHFAGDSRRILECVERVNIVKVNRHTVELFDAASEDDLVGPLLPLLSMEGLDSVAVAFLRFWDGHVSYTCQTVKRSLLGRHLDVIVTGTALPGRERSLDRVLVAVQNISGQEAAYRRLAAAERYARGLFQHSPVCVWVEDLSIVRDMLDALKAGGVTDFETYFNSNPDFISSCIREIRIVEVNDETLRLFRAPDQATLLSRITEVFRPEVNDTFREHLLFLWEGTVPRTHEVTNFSLLGEQLTMHMQFSVFPGHEDDWALVQVALTDITARKKAEAHLAFLSTRDALTGLLNRTFYVDEIARLERTRDFPVSIIILDLNGLKQVNDRSGHAAGDEVLRRMGQILTEAVAPPAHACRTGGDEFAIFMPNTNTATAFAMLKRIEALVERENARCPVSAIEFAAGIGTAHYGDRIDDVIRAADARMYDAKADYYLNPAHDQR